MTMRRFTDALITVILMMCVVPAGLALLVAMTVWCVVAVVAYLVLALTGLILPKRSRQMLLHPAPDGQEKP